MLNQSASRYNAFLAKEEQNKMCDISMWPPKEQNENGGLLKKCWN
jgi:hypothetical protein